MDATIDGFGFMAPLPMRIIGRLFMKKKYLRMPVPPGFDISEKLKSNFHPPDEPAEAAFARLVAAVERLQATESCGPHPFFGTLTRDESDTVQLRHAELHMSFVVPKAN